MQFKNDYGAMLVEPESDWDKMWVRDRDREGEERERKTVCACEKEWQREREKRERERQKNIHTTYRQTAGWNDIYDVYICIYI